MSKFLSDSLYFLAPDQRDDGHSHAPKRIEDDEIGLLVHDYKRIIDNFGVPVMVLGQESGTAVTCGLAIAHPELVLRLIIMTVVPFPFQRPLCKEKRKILLFNIYRGSVANNRRQF